MWKTCSWPVGVCEMRETENQQELGYEMSLIATDLEGGSVS